MNWIVASIGILIILIGLVIGRFKLVNLLSNVEGVRVIDKAKATRYTAYYLCILGSCFVILSYFIDKLGERDLMVIMACFIPINMVLLVLYMVAQSHNMR